MDTNKPIGVQVNHSENEFQKQLEQMKAVLAKREQELNPTQFDGNSNAENGARP